MRAGAASLLAVSLVAATPALSLEKPTQTGDPIGTVTMLPGGAIKMHLRSVQCDGTIAEGAPTILPSDKNYRDIIAHVGGLKPLETKTMPAWPVPPCPSNQKITKFRG